MAKRKRKEQEGDVIGISHPKGRIPRATSDTGGHPRGVDVVPEPETAGIRDLKQGPGATGVDVGAGNPSSTIPRSNRTN